MEIALLMVVVLAVSAILVLQLRGRHAPSPSKDSDDNRDPAPSADLVLAPDEVLVLPPVDKHASAVVLAQADSLAALERAGLLAPRAKRRPFQGLIDGVTRQRRGGERRRVQTLADEPLEGGYLKLSEESRRQLEEGTPVVTRTGELLGMVNDDRGKRRHLLRFTDYKSAANPNLVLAVANLRAMAALQEQMEAVEERLIQVQQTLSTLCKELDYDRLSDILSVKETLQETADDVRRRGCMTQTDMISVIETRQTIKRQLRSAHFNLTDLTRDFNSARSRRQRLEVFQEVLKTNRLDFWLAMFVEAELAHVRSDVLKLLYEATEHPESSMEFERATRDKVEARRRELAAVGALLRDISDPQARRWLDHFQQISHYKLSRQRPIVEGLLEKHSDVFAEYPLLTAASD